MVTQTTAPEMGDEFYGTKYYDPLWAIRQSGDRNAIRAEAERIYNPIGSKLEAEGWKTPDTYGRSDYAALPRAPGVYLLLECGPVWNPHQTVAYVGMSTNLWQRLERNVHPQSRHLKDGNGFQRWFRLADEVVLRELERELIDRFRPPLNTQGKQVSLRDINLGEWRPIPNE